MYMHISIYMYMYVKINVKEAINLIDGKMDKSTEGIEG